MASGTTEALDPQRDHCTHGTLSDKYRSTPRCGPCKRQAPWKVLETGPAYVAADTEDPDQVNHRHGWEPGGCWGPHKYTAPTRSCQGVWRTPPRASVVGRLPCTQPCASSGFGAGVLRPAGGSSVWPAGGRQPLLIIPPATEQSFLTRSVATGGRWTVSAGVSPGTFSALWTRRGGRGWAQCSLCGRKGWGWTGAPSTAATAPSRLPSSPAGVKGLELFIKAREPLGGPGLRTKRDQAASAEARHDPFPPPAAVGVPAPHPGGAAGSTAQPAAAQACANAGAPGSAPHPGKPQEAAAEPLLAESEPAPLLAEASTSSAPRDSRAARHPAPARPHLF